MTSRTSCTTLGDRLRLCALFRCSVFAKRLKWRLDERSMHSRKFQSVPAYVWVFFSTPMSNEISKFVENRGMARNALGNFEETEQLPVITTEINLISKTWIFKVAVSFHLWTKKIYVQLREKKHQWSWKLREKWSWKRSILIDLSTGRKYLLNRHNSKGYLGHSIYSVQSVSEWMYRAAVDSTWIKIDFENLSVLYHEFSQG